MKSYKHDKAVMFLQNNGFNVQKKYDSNGKLIIEIVGMKIEASPDIDTGEWRVRFGDMSFDWNKPNVKEISQKWSFFPKPIIIKLKDGEWENQEQILNISPENDTETEIKALFTKSLC
ncbi:hypothetical protein E6Q11_01720 [Candidatus Dojkabacteria bacterium]|uniref:Uncharacterized protein n=1 Tax=Candidatus Dojkabacteria bacterium TaxID=2099670 RepID=A0A5C7J8Z5_9BACT|nr:MAG: hypothetical protein E6Q11_01720 [Candidatus Dojkabacteria bacterium]